MRPHDARNPDAVTELEGPCCDAGIIIAGVALAPAIAITTIGFIGYSLTASPAAVAIWHPLGYPVPTLTAETLVASSWPGTVETLSMLSWRMILGGASTLALLGVTLLALDVAGTIRCVPPSVLGRLNAPDCVWPRIVGFLIAATTAWLVYSSLLLFLV